MAINLKKQKQLTSDEIAQWESEDKHKRKITHAKFASEFIEGGVAHFWLIPPNRSNIEAAASYGKEKIRQANDLTLNACIVAGDVEVIEQDDELYFSILGEISNIYDVKKKL